MKTIEINGDTYVSQKDLGDDFKKSDVQIVVLNRGWIAVGNVFEKDSKTIIKGASIIRRWGTENGIGEIAENGPLRETILDKCPDITVETCNIILTINCNQDKW